MIKKTVTERVLSANRENGKKNPGPRNTFKTRYNAQTHGLLAKYIIFRDDIEKKEFDALVAKLFYDHDPRGATEQSLVSEMAIALWRLQNVNRWEFLEVSARENAAATILQGLRENSKAQELPLFAATQQSWTAQELTVRTGSRSRGEEEALLGDSTDKTGHITVEAKMISSLETVLRYGASIRRDFYRALAVLRELQQDRLQLDDLPPADQEKAHED